MVLAFAASIVFLGNISTATNGESGSASTDLDSDLALAAESYAIDYDVSFEEALDRLVAQEASDVVHDALKEIAPERLVSVRIEHSRDRSQLVARFKGDADVVIPAHIVETSPLDVVVMTGYEHTADEVNEALSDLLPALFSLSPGVDGIYYDETTEEIVIDSSGPNAIANARSAENVVADLGLPVRVDIHTAPAANGNRGGLHLTSCTSGFTVRNPAGTRGLLTAGHCSNTQSYQLYGLSSWYSTTFRSELYNGYADVQWHSRSSTTFYPSFFMSSTTTAVSVTSYTMRGNQNGKYVCHRGKATNHSCGTVNSVTYAPGNNICNGSCTNTYVRVAGSTLRCYLGDSGGPVAVSGSAYGIYKGQSSSGTTASACNFMFYMPIEYAFNLGVSLYM